MFRLLVRETSPKCYFALSPPLFLQTNNSNLDECDPFVNL